MYWRPRSSVIEPLAERTVTGVRPSTASPAVAFTDDTDSWASDCSCASAPFLCSDVTIAFLAFWTAILFARAIRLGDPFTIPIYRLENGALLIFAFFMISDPRTTPDSRLGRILFAGIVAGGACYVQFKMFHTNALLWSLVFAAPIVPLIDLVLRAPKFEWRTSCFDTLQSSPSLSR